jgi:hypothetical protein
VYREVHIVSQRKAGTTTASIPKVTAYPQGINLGLCRRLQKPEQGTGSPSRSVADVMHNASVGVGIKYVIERQARERVYKLLGFHVLPPANGM